MLRILGYAATRDLIPWYGVYALLFGEHGLSAGAISSLFVIWSVSSFVFEVPSGAWADTYDRRQLLVWSSYLSAIAFALWTVWPTYPGFAVGFALWGLSGAMVSGTFEALVYDELAGRGSTAAYARLLGWTDTAANAAIGVGIVLATPLYAVGGFALVGWTSVAVAAASGVLAKGLPNGSPPHSQSIQGASTAPGSTVNADVDGELDSAGVGNYVAALRAGVREATRHADVRRVVLISAAVLGITAYDEYLPLVASESGASTATVPLLLGAVTAGQLAGTALAGRTAHFARRTLGAIVAASAVLLAAGAASGHPLGFVAIAVAFGLIHNAVIVTEARLQDAITGRARATATSVSGLATEVVVLAVYGALAVGSSWLSVSVLVALCAVPTVGVAAATARWLPDRRPVGLGEESDRLSS